MPYRGKSEARSRKERKTSQSRYRISSCVPRWEKQFCLDIGGMRWKDVLKAKQYISEIDKIMQWDDSEGKECFYNAKNRYWLLNYVHAPYCSISLPNPDKYIDEIDWNSELDTQLLIEVEEARKQVPRKEENSIVLVDNPWMLPFEHIKPTGWDACEDWHGPRWLTGMIIGDGQN